MLNGYLTDSEHKGPIMSGQILLLITRIADHHMAFLSVTVHRQQNIKNNLPRIVSRHGAFLLPG